MNYYQKLKSDYNKSVDLAIHAGVNLSQADIEHQSEYPVYNFDTCCVIPPDGENISEDDLESLLLDHVGRNIFLLGYETDHSRCRPYECPEHDEWDGMNRGFCGEEKRGRTVRIKVPMGFNQFHSTRFSEKMCELLKRRGHNAFVEYMLD